MRSRGRARGLGSHITEGAVGDHSMVFGVPASIRAPRFGCAQVECVCPDRRPVEFADPIPGHLAELFFWHLLRSAVVSRIHRPVMCPVMEG